MQLLAGGLAGGAALGLCARLVRQHSKSPKLFRASSATPPPPDERLPTAPKKAAPKIEGTSLRRLVTLAQPEKWRLAGATVFLVGSSAVTMAVPFAIGRVVDLLYSAETGQAAAVLAPLCAPLLGVFAAGAACNFGRVYLINLSGQRITNQLRADLYAAVLRQELGFFDTSRTGELLSRLSSDTQLAGNALSQNLSDGLRSGIMAIAGVAMMVSLSPKLSLVGLGVVPAVAAAAAVYGRRLRRLATETQSALAEATQLAEERIGHARIVKSCSQERAEAASYAKRLERVVELARKESLARGLFFALTGFSGNVVVLMGLMYGGTMVSTHEITAGALSSFLLYAAYVGVAVGGLGSFYSELAKGLGASSRLWNILDRRPALPFQGGEVPSDVPQGNLTFDNVWFAYPSRPEVPVLRGLRLKAEAGKVTAVVGASGSGKSTLALLLLSLHAPQQGQVLLDSLSVGKLEPTWLRRHIALVPQEPAMFADTVMANLLYGAPEHILQHPNLQELVEEAAKEANALQFIEKLPQRFDTLLGERGATLSAGQRQRLAIARAILRRPAVLLLDEATSALDAESEALVQEALERASQGRTVLTIAHRLSTVRNADSIAVLEGGQIAEQGTYEQLMAMDAGVFRRLVQHQTFQEPATS